MLLEGLHIPLTTPFHPDGRLNAHKLAANILRYSRTPASGLIVLGPAGEPSLLSDEETREALHTAAQAASPEKVLIAGICRDSVRSTLALADFAAGSDYDALLIGTPAVLVRTETHELQTHFQTIADRSPLPIVLLSTETRALTADTVTVLATHPNIIGLLDTSPASSRISAVLQRAAGRKRDVTVTHVFASVTGRMQKAASRASGTLVSPGSLTSGTAVADPVTTNPLRTRTKAVGFQILAGNTTTMLDALNAGATGVAPKFAACAPQACYEVFAAWKDQDQPLAAEKQHRLLEAAQLTDSLGPSALKFAADLNGYFGGLPRLPHLPPTGEQRDRIQQVLKPLHN